MILDQALSSSAVVLNETSSPEESMSVETVRPTSCPSPALIPAEQVSGQSKSLDNLSEALLRAYSQSDVRIEVPATEKADFIASQRVSFRVGKRLFDILFAAAALLVLAPIFLVCAACICVTSGGSVLFRQRRLGRRGKDFSIVKFRTMLPNAEALLHKVLESDPGAKQEWERDQKLRNDPRVTPLGRFLRRTSMDELPQFWNVLIGDMSLVGPRPIVRSEMRFYLSAMEIYSAVRPGITGLWQVSGRNDTGYSRRIALDCQYVRTWSTWLDLCILLRTLNPVVLFAGAY
jgi:exopolysaccharide production protein ExoY